MKIQKTLFSDKSIVIEKTIPIVKKKVAFKLYSQEQDFLLPKSLNDFVQLGHISRMISEIIDGMCIDNIIETYKGGGTSAYNPRMLLKVWILGFVNKIFNNWQLFARKLLIPLSLFNFYAQNPRLIRLKNRRTCLRRDIKNSQKKQN